MSVTNGEMTSASRIKQFDETLSPHANLHYMLCSVVHSLAIPIAFWTQGVVMA